MPAPPRQDVAVVGGGPAGCATAIELRRLGVERVVVLDAGKRSFPVGESLPPETGVLIDRLGIRDDFLAAGHERCPGSCSAWGSDELGYNDFIVNPHGSGWHLDRARFDADLAGRVEAVGATVRAGRVRTVDRLPDGGFRIDAGPTTVDAARVVDATGAWATVSRRLGARRRVHDRLTCVVGFVRLPPGSPMTGMTILEAVPDGWWYAARLPGELAIAMLATEPAIAKRRALLDEMAFRRALDRTGHVAPALDGAELIPGSLGARRALSAVTEPAAGDGWLAVGDAATAFDPLSSQGIHHALADGLGAADALVAWRFGDLTGLAHHAESVRRRFVDYLAVRNHMYSLETRWEREPFWTARRLVTIADPATPPDPTGDEGATPPTPG